MANRDKIKQAITRSLYDIDKIEQLTDLMTDKLSTIPEGLSARTYFCACIAAANYIYDNRYSLNDLVQEVDIVCGNYPEDDLIINLAVQYSTYMIIGSMVNL